MKGLRAFLAAYSVIFMALCGLLIALAWDQGRQLDLGLGDWSLKAYITSGDSEKWAFSLLAFLLGLMALATFVLAIAPPAKRQTAFRVRHPDGSSVEVRAESLEAMLHDEISRLPDIVAADVFVQFWEKRVVTDVEATIAPSANVSYMTQAVGYAVARVLGDQVGLDHVRRPAITFRFEDGRTPPPAPIFERPQPETSDV